MTSIRPSLAELFVTNLRLLDLDTRSDWPNISSKTFSKDVLGQNQKNRIRCSEWALYRLFELWDPEETRDVSRVIATCTLTAHTNMPVETAAFLSTAGASTIPQSPRCPVSPVERTEEKWRACQRNHTPQNNAGRMQGRQVFGDSRRVFHGRREEDCPATHCEHYHTAIRSCQNRNRSCARTCRARLPRTAFHRTSHHAVDAFAEEGRCQSAMPTIC